MVGDDIISDEYFDAHNVFFQQSASKEHLEDLLSICNNDIPEVTQLYCKNINILAFLAFDC